MKFKVGDKVIITGGHKDRNDSGLFPHCIGKTGIILSEEPHTGTYPFDWAVKVDFSERKGIFLFSESEMKSADLTLFNIK